MAEFSSAARPRTYRTRTVHLLDLLTVFFSFVGESTLRYTGAVMAGTKWLSDRLLRRHYRYVNRKLQKGRIRLMHIFSWVTRPVRAVAAGTATVYGAWQEGRGQPHSKQAELVFGAVGQVTVSARKFWVTLFHYLLPLAATAGFIAVVHVAASASYGVQVVYEGKVLGYVRDETALESARHLVQERLVYLDEAERIQIKPDYSVKLVRDEDVLTENQLADQIITLSSDNILEAEGLYIDNVFCGAVQEAGQLQALLDNHLETYRTSDNEEISFVNEVKILPGIYLTDNIVSLDKIAGQVEEFSTPEQYYTVTSGDTPEVIAKKNDISLERLYALNDEIAAEGLSEGQQLLVNPAQPTLPVQVSLVETYTETVDFEVEQIENSAFPSGFTHISEAGKAGENEVTARFYYVGGEEINREILTVNVLSQPKTQYEVIGIGNYTKGVASTGAGTVPALIWPLDDYRRISSGVGARWGGTHKGLDIPCPTGTPVKAAADGIVFESSRQGSYGNIVKIDHGDGVQTYYAHNSELLVEEGDAVFQGDTIARSGNTGYSTGPHVHFEVRIHGEYKDPEVYLP